MMNTWLSDNAFEIAFENCKVPPSQFNHEAHLRLAWIHIQKYALETAIGNVCTQLRTYVEHLGATDKYNTTLTVASIKMVNHFMGKSNSNNFPDFMIEFPQLKTRFKELIGAHYAVDIFNSEQAKKKYMEPDLLPFD
ncbi:hypothetical protein [Flagellimonas algicola]|uniref:Uncharacterized protein n=1 Tax=Flagellimonas algicola TaxID=2583815 RepID=A0ABY2WKV1_9FLAO|nr:hypothetical protein [Allomuricauda algicola]TMU55338.1 hypothetical protein FGG15_14270 [Allomuricauda algicola]